MRTILPLAILLALAGCDELSAYDDPRDWGGGSSAERGTCSGISLRCNMRQATQCGAGCEVVTACQSADKQRCLSHDTATSCERDEACFWIVDHCELASADAVCAVHGAQFACTNEESENCDWGPECQGYADSCSDAENETACLVNVGCEWDPA